MSYDGALIATKYQEMMFLMITLKYIYKRDNHFFKRFKIDVTNGQLCDYDHCYVILI